MSNENTKPGSILDDITDLVNTGKEMVGIARQGFGAKGTKTLHSEAVDPLLATRLRKLVETTSDRGGVTFRMEGGAVRAIIGEGRTLRVFDGASVGESIDQACAAEGIEVEEPRSAGGAKPETPDGE